MSWLLGSSFSSFAAIWFPNPLPPSSNRKQKRSVPTCELTEEAQRLKRAAWRAASRRYYARKIARQQVKPQRSAPLVPVLSSQVAQPPFMLDRRRRTQISQLPEQSQESQREAWRAASRRYYARKNAHLQTQSHQFGHLSFNPDGSAQGPNREGPHSTSGGGIMCSWRFSEKSWNFYGVFDQ